MFYSLSVFGLHGNLIQIGSKLFFWRPYYAKHLYLQEKLYRMCITSGEYVLQKMTSDEILIGYAPTTPYNNDGHFCFTF